MGSDAASSLTSLDEIRATANRAYPVELLEGCETGLCLFGAGFYGRNDGIHMLDAGLSVTVVDIDVPKLGVMRSLYPPDWKFVHGDAFKTAEWLVRHGHTYDVVSVDPHLALTARCVKSRSLWLGLANRLATLTVRTWLDEPLPPFGWTSLPPRRRTDSSAWLVYVNEGGIWWS